MLFCSVGMFAQDNRRVSIFADHIGEVANQQRITYREAAQKVYDLGYRGADVRVDCNPDNLKALDEVGFQHASAIVDINFADGDHLDKIQEAISFMHAHGFNKVLLVPGLLPKKCSDELRAEVIRRIVYFTTRAKAEGLEVMVEDYDNKQSLCYNMAGIDQIFAVSPETGHVFDSGNYLFAGEDALVALNHFQKQTHHVHLKDRASATDMASVAGGTGVIPIKDVVKTLLSSGYDGWFCVEHFGVKDMFGCAKISIETVNEAYKEFEATHPHAEGMRPGMTENWTPQPRIVAPGCQATASAPADAIVLFDGTNLNEWRKDNGEAAGWKVQDGVMTVDKSQGDIITKRTFGSYQLHIEWCVPEGIEGSSQARGNSGVFMQDMYEVQILDSYNNETYVQGQAASIYKQTAPLVNAMRKPGEWNVYDIIYTAPVFKADGTYLYHPYVTVIHNGVVVQNHTEIYGTTEYIGTPRTIKHSNGPIRLQSHGDPSAPISFRNIWIREL